MVSDTKCVMNPGDFGARNSGKQAHKSGMRQVWDKEFLFFSGIACDGFGGKVAAADAAFHGGWPAGSCPIAGEIDAGPRALHAGTNAVEERAYGICSADFLHHCSLQELCRLYHREKLREFAHGEIDDLLPLHWNKGFRSADDEFDVVFLLVAMGGLQLRLIEEPLDGRVQQDRVFVVCDFAIKPQMDARDGRVLELGQVRRKSFALSIAR